MLQHTLMRLRLLPRRIYFWFLHQLSLRILWAHSVEVQCYLFDVAKGKRPRPCHQQLHELALYLGDAGRAKSEWMK